jgi:hypothetical protein
VESEEKDTDLTKLDENPSGNPIVLAMLNITALIGIGFKKNRF